MTRDYPARPSRRQGRGERYAEGRERGVKGSRRDRVGRGGQNRGLSYRLFVAVEIPEDAITGLVAWQREHLAADRGLRMTPEGQLHVTLAFLGQKDEHEKEKAAEVLGIVDGSEAFEVTCNALVGLPKGRSPRVIAAACEEPSGRLKGIHDTLAAALVENDLYEREKRPYFPHVTIARSKGRSRLDAAGISPDPVKFTAVRVTLYNSVLKASGALHEALETVQLT